MGIDSSLRLLDDLCADFNTALERAADVWDDRLADSIRADEVNEMTACAGEALDELEHLRQQVEYYMQVLCDLCNY